MFSASSVIVWGLYELGGIACTVGDSAREAEEREPSWISIGDRSGLLLGSLRRCCWLSIEEGAWSVPWSPKEMGWVEKSTGGC